MVYNRRDIDRIFTEIIQKYLDDGWLIHTPAAAGHQGEIFKITLAKGNRCVRVLMSSFSRDEGARDDIGGIVVIVGEHKDSDEGGRAADGMYLNAWTSPLSHSPLWNDDFIELERRRFYAFSDNAFNAGWTENKQEVVAARELHSSRYSARYTPRYPTYIPKDQERAKKVLIPLIRTLPGMKTIRLSEVGTIERVRYSDHSGATYVSWETTARGAHIRFERNRIYLRGKCVCARKEGNHG